METSEHINEIAGALAKAQAGLGKLIASKTAEVQTKKGRDYSYTYANLADALEACRATLNEQGIAVVQETAASERNGVEVRTMLVHGSGQWMRSDALFMPVQGGAQDIGSAVTYARRYQLLAMVGLAPEDDDGAAAQAAKPANWGGGQRRQSEPKRDAIGPRCRGSKWPGDLGRENERLMRDISAAEDMNMGGVWDRALDLARVDLGPYVQTDGRPPQSTADLSTADGKALKKALGSWLGELANG